MMQETVKRLQQYVKNMEKKYPNCWKGLEMFYLQKGQNLPSWPDWCYVPVAGSYAVISQGTTITNMEKVQDIPIMHALAGWRLTQGIYDFNKPLYQELIKTPYSGNVPSEVLFGLPEWSIYIKCPDDEDIYGFFATLEHDPNTDEAELRLIFDSDEGLYPMMIHLGGTIEEGLEDSIDFALNSFKKSGVTPEELAKAGSKTGLLSPEEEKVASLLAGENADPELLKQGVEGVASKPKKYLPLVMYLCSKKPEYKDVTPSGNPRLKKTKKGKRLFPTKKPKYYELGYRISRFLKDKSLSESDNKSGSTGGEITAHIRRAHWHTYWTGPRKNPENQKPVLRWIPPTPVGFNWDETEEKLIPTIKKVQREK